MPITITFLDGAHANREIDLGIFQAGFSSSQGADWGTEEGKTIRAGGKFNKINPRTSRLDVEYFFLNEDSSFLTENLAHMTELIPDLKRPAQLHLTVGAEEHSPVVCNSINVSKSVPLPGKKGYRRATVSLEFTLFGGAQSEHQLGKPLAPTPLNNLRLQESPEAAIARQLEGAVNLLLAPCLGDQGTSAVHDLIKNNQLNDPGALASLPSGALTQLAVGGLIPEDMLKNDVVRDTLREDLAGSMASATPNVGTGSTGRRYARALGTGDGSRLGTELRSGLVETRNDYTVIADALTQGGDWSKTINVNSNPSALEKLTQFASCGMSLKDTGAAIPRGSQTEKLNRINQINDFLSPNPDNAAIMERFGVDSKGADRIRNAFKSSEFSDELDFGKRAGTNGMAGLGIFERYQEPEPVPPDEEFDEF
jgi:hypothetical protein